MTIAAQYVDGVFKPLETVPVKEGTVVEVLIPASPRAPSGRRSIRESSFFGLWKDRVDIVGGTEYVDALRDNPRE
jgi:predicted DNA-binding antitoxin AbrB/MazE fold protein